MRKLILLSLVLFCGSVLYAQDVKQNYMSNKRDVGAVKAYYESLLASKKKAEADSVRREYMSRCPVVQIVDKDTYLLLNDMLFNDPYSNVFEYGVYAYKKMTWDRFESTEKLSSKAEAMKSIFKGFSVSASKADEIDKRFEAFSLITKSLEREISTICEPKYVKDHYEMPPFDVKKAEHLEYLAGKAGNDGLLLKLYVAKAISAGDYNRAVNSMVLFSSIGSAIGKSNYHTNTLLSITDKVTDKDLLKNILDSTAKTDENSQLLSKLYFLCGDNQNGEKYKKIYDAIEAQRIEQFGDLFKALGK